MPDVSNDRWAEAILAALKVETGNPLIRPHAEEDLAELAEVLARQVFGYDRILHDFDGRLARVARGAVLEAVRRRSPAPHPASAEWGEWVARVRSDAQIRMRTFR
jgi:hypothetical protein